MAIDWGNVLARLQKYDAGVHRLFPPCPIDRIAAVEKKLGKLPDDLKEMLLHFNGGQLFDGPQTLATLFGISTNPPMTPRWWEPDSYIDKSTAGFRTALRRKDFWMFAETADGLLVTMDAQGALTGLDMHTNTWKNMDLHFPVWVEQILREGDAAFKQKL